MYRLIQNGALKFLQQIYKAGALWTPRDCRIQRTSPGEEAYKEFTKCLTLILTAAKLYSVKTLQRELLTYVAKQLPFFIFPPNRCRHKKQNHLIKRAKKFQGGKWEDLWKQSILKFEIEKRNIKPQKELSTAHKVRNSEHFHQHGEISRAKKYAQTMRSQLTTRGMWSISDSYSLTQVQTMPVIANGRRLSTTLAFKN